MLGKQRLPATGTTPAEAPTPAAAARSAGALPGPETDALGPDGLSSSYEFDLDYLDRRGHRWTGHFHAHVLTLRDRVRVGLTRASILGHAPVAAVDPATLDVAEMQATLAVAVDEGPGWASRLHEFRDVGLLAAVYGEVAAYERRFHGPAAPGGGDVGGEDR